MGKHHDERDRLGRLWLDEAARFECNGDDLDTVQCTELADELWHQALAAVEDPDFETEQDEWHSYTHHKGILLALEQSCYRGVPLKIGHRAFSPTMGSFLAGGLAWFMYWPPHRLLSAMRVLRLL